MKIYHYLAVFEADAPIFAFTTEPASGTANPSDSYSFSWTLNDTPDSVVLQRWISGEGFVDYKTLSGSPSTMEYDEAVFDLRTNDYRIQATKGSDTVNSDKFTVTWTEDAPTSYTITSDNGQNYILGSSQTLTFTCDSSKKKERILRKHCTTVE